MRISDWSSDVCSSDLIVRKFADQTGFVVHPRRWIVERTFAWIHRNRRLAKDFERTIKSATALLYAAAAIVLIRRIARYPCDSRQTLKQISLLDGFLGLRVAVRRLYMDVRGARTRETYVGL